MATLNLSAHAEGDSFIVPYPRNPQFTGRTKLLETMRERFFTQIPMRYSPRIALYGLGGVGKTQLALEYCYRSRHHYDRIYWLSASDQASLMSGYQTIASKSGIPLFSGSKPAEIAQLVVAWLKQQRSWLLVFDNLDDMTVAQGLLPENGTKKHTLITTRNPNADDIQAEGFEVPVLDPEDSVDLLLALSHIPPSTDVTEQQVAYEIVSELGYLPLAIEQAASYVREVTGSLAAFQDQYSRNRLKRPPIGFQYYSNTVATTWSLVFQEVENTHAQASKLLQLLSFLDPDGVMVAFLVAGAGAFETDLKQIILDDYELAVVLLVLEKYSLIKWDRVSQTLSIHRLVQAVIKDGMSDSDLTSTVKTVVELCDRSFPIEISNKTRPLCRMYEGQVVQPLLRVDIRTKKCASIKERVGIFLREDGKYKQSEMILQQALDVCAELFGWEDSSTVNVMLQLARTYAAQGRLIEAAVIEEKVLETRLRILKEEHPDTLTSMDHLASTYRDQGRLQEAADLNEKVLEAMRRVLGEKHPDTLTSMNNLASTYRDQGKLQEATALDEKVLEERRSILGEEHPDTLISMNNLASTYRDQGKLQEAAVLDEKVLEERRRILGEEHPDTLMSMNNLASTYRDQGKLQEAAALNEKVLEAMRRILGEEHPDTLTSMNNLASTYRDQGKLQEAAALKEKVLEAMRRILGEEHPDTLTSMNNLASIFRDQGKLQEAAYLNEKVLESMRRILGEEHPETLTSMNNLASIFRDQGKLQEAAYLNEKVLEAMRRILGEEHPDTLISMNNLASTYRDQGKLREAADLEEKVLEKRRRILGEEHPSTILAITALSLIYREGGRTEEASQLLEQLLEWQRKVLGEAHPNTLAVMDELSVTFKDLGRMKEAIDMEEKASKLRETIWAER